MSDLQWRMAASKLLLDMAKQMEVISNRQEEILAESRRKNELLQKYVSLYEDNEQRDDWWKRGDKPPH